MTELTFDAQLDEQLRRLKRLLPCCPNCNNFTSRVVMGAKMHDGYLETTDEYCILDPERRRIPARVVAFGCPGFDPAIPF